MVAGTSTAERHLRIDSITLSILQIVFRRASAAGMDLSRLIARYQLPCNADDILNGSISSMQRTHLIPLYKEAMLAIADAASERENVVSSNFDQSAMMFYATIGCQNLESAINKAIKFIDSIYSGNIKLYLKLEDNIAEFGFKTSRKIKSIDNFLLDLFGIYSFYHFFSWIVGETIPLRKISLCHKEFIPNSELSEIFCQNFTFNDERNTIAFPKKYLEHSIIRSYRDLEEMLLTFPFEMIPRQLISDSLTDRTKEMFRIILKNECRMPTFDEVAEGLNVGASTLRRHLARDHVSVRSLKENCRRDTAINLLKLTNLSIEEISFRVGFSAPNAFRRAVYVWTGSSPSTFRKKEGKSDLSMIF